MASGGSGTPLESTKRWPVDTPREPKASYNRVTKENTTQVGGRKDSPAAPLVPPDPLITLVLHETLRFIKHKIMAIFFWKGGVLGLKKADLRRAAPGLSQARSSNAKGSLETSVRPLRSSCEPATAHRLLVGRKLWPVEARALL